MAAAPRSVLCGVDGSDGSIRAAALAGSVAAVLDAELVLVHVTCSRTRRVVQIGLQRTAAAGQDGTRAAALLAEAADHAGPGTVWTRRVEARRESDGLLRAAQVERPVLMVVGARGRSALGAALLGSVSAELPLRASCPVMVLPAHAPVPRFSTARGLRPAIVCGVVDSEDGQSAARIAGELARALDARLHLVYSRMPMPPLGGGIYGRHGLAVSYEILVESEQRVALALLERAAGWTGCAEEQVEPALEIGEPAERIEAVGRKEGAVMAVVGSRGRGPFRAAVLGSTSRTLASLAGRPVVIASKSAFMTRPPVPRPP
jgi:nucleotide-binding universal stress UspA family protein